MEPEQTPAPEASAEPSIETVVDAGGALEATPEERQPVSLEDAFARAQEEVTPSQPDSEGEQQEDGEKPASGAAPEAGQGESGKSPEPPSSVEAELDRIYSHIKNGTIEKLPPNLRGRAYAIQRDVIQAHTEEQQLMDGLRERFLQLEAARIEDPDEFNRLMWEDPQAAELREFYDTMKREFPGLNLDNPTYKPPQPNAEQARDATAREIFTDMNQAIVAMATEAGLPAARVDELRSGAQGPWSFLASAFTEAVKAAAEKQREAIRAEERKAASLEAQAEWSGKKVVTPRELGQPSGKPARTTSGGFTWEDAFAAAQEGLLAS